MKKILSYLLCILVIISCSKFDDSQLKSDITSAGDRLAQLEKLLNAQSSKLTVTSVEERDGMQIIVFSDGSSVLVSDGKDGLPGKDGKDVQLGEGPFIVSFYVQEGIVTFVISTGEKISFPMESSVHDVIIDIRMPENLFVVPGGAIEIPYTVSSYYDAELQIEALTSSDLNAAIVRNDNSSGFIKVTMGQVITESSKITILASNGFKVAMKSVSFVGNDITITKSDAYEVSSSGGAVNLIFLSDADYYVKIDDADKSWIKCVETKAMACREASLEIQPNAGEERSARITICSKDGAEVLDYRIVQAGINVFDVPAGVFGPMPFKIIVDKTDFVEGHGLENILSQNDCYRITNKVTLIKIISEIPFTVKDFKFTLATNAPFATYNHYYSVYTSCNGQRYNFFGKYSSSSSHSTQNHDITRYNIEGFVRGIMLEIDLKPDCGDFIDLSNLRFVATPCNMDFRTMDDLDVLGHNHKYSPLTPMGKTYENAIEPSEEELAELSDPDFEPEIYIGGHNWQQKEVVLYPNGDPIPDDVNQHNIGDCAALSIFADFAYLYPDFIKSIIKDNKNNSYTVSMYDPKGEPVSVTVSDRLIVDENGEIGMCTSKDGSAGWATILEKAMMKWESIYKVQPNVEGINSFDAAPLFTGNGTSFSFQPGDLSPEEMKNAIKVALDSRWLTSGGFSSMNSVTGNGTMTVTHHAYSFMFSSLPNSLFVMRNPWGYTLFKDYECSNGAMEITDDGYIPSIIDMIFIHPGAAFPYAKNKLEPYSYK